MYKHRKANLLLKKNLCQGKKIYVRAESQKIISEMSTWARKKTEKDSWT
jgi:hypothetical protein